MPSNRLKLKIVLQALSILFDLIIRFRGYFTHYFFIMLFIERYCEINEALLSTGFEKYQVSLVHKCIM